MMALVAGLVIALAAAAWVLAPLLSRGAPGARAAFCPDCGEPLAPDARFCSNCGRAIPG